MSNINFLPSHMSNHTQAHTKHTKAINAQTNLFLMAFAENPLGANAW